MQSWIMHLGFENPFSLILKHDYKLQSKVIYGYQFLSPKYLDSSLKTHHFTVTITRLP